VRVFNDMLIRVFRQIDCNERVYFTRLNGKRKGAMTSMAPLVVRLFLVLTGFVG
jgi:hypothetical protein